MANGQEKTVGIGEIKAECTPDVNEIRQHNVETTQLRQNTENDANDERTKPM
jgi:hypothetical protein